MQAVNERQTFSSNTSNFPVATEWVKKVALTAESSDQQFVCFFLINMILRKKKSLSSLSPKEKQWEAPSLAPSL